jgi:hypothetical protein
METLEQNYPLTAIPIAVHNGDIMTNTLYGHYARRLE